MVKLYIMGKDKRQEILRELYKRSDSLVENISEANYVALPIPFSKDGTHVTGEEISVEEIYNMLENKTVFTGAVSAGQKRNFEINNVHLIDLMCLEEVAIKNAIPTAEGAIVKAMEMRDEVLFGSNALVMGFGRVGKVLADRLKGMGANVFCEARKEKDIALASSLRYNVVRLEDLENELPKMDIIFNTIPFMILNARLLAKVKKDAIIIDLASSPGGVDFEAAKKLGVKSELYLSIPAKVAPRSAARYIKETMDQVLKGG